MSEFLPFPQKKYNIIYADPPWRYSDRNSRKPDEVRDRIVELLGDLLRIELLAREAAPGWDCWGKEAPINGVFRYDD